jgi:metal-responsive CopG/Arc/MetJ family transcriptional regulator
LNVFVPKAVIERLDDVRNKEGVRSRAEALQLAITGLLDPRRELMRVLVSDEALSRIDEVREANHLTKRADAIELVLRTALGNPSIRQELGL